jgi:hypothetical protein
MNAILLRSLPFPDPDRVVTLFSIPPGDPDQPNGVSVPDLLRDAVGHVGLDSLTLDPAKRFSLSV